MKLLFVISRNPHSHVYKDTKEITVIISGLCHTDFEVKYEFSGTVST